MGRFIRYIHGCQFGSLSIKYHTKVRYCNSRKLNMQIIPLKINLLRNFGELNSMKNRCGCRGVWVDEVGSGRAGSGEVRSRGGRGFTLNNTLTGSARKLHATLGRGGRGGRGVRGGVVVMQGGEWRRVEVWDIG